MGRRARAPGPRSLDPLRDRLPLAVPALHGHRLDVPGRLRPRGIRRPAPGRRAVSSRGRADIVASRRPGARERAPGPGRRDRPHLRHGGGPAEPRLPRLRSAIRAREHGIGGPPSPVRVHRLSADAVGADAPFAGAPARRMTRLGGGVLALLVGAIGPASAQELPAEVVSDLEREVAPRSEARCPDPGAYSLTRPDPAGRATVVGVGVFFQDVASLSDADQSVDADIYLVERWRDPRLADPALAEGSADCPVPEGRVWMPALEPESLRSRQAFYPAHFLVDGRGVVTWVRRLWVRVSYPLDFRDFPLDRHRWMLTLWPVLSRADEVVFHPLRRMTG